MDDGAAADLREAETGVAVSAIDARSSGERGEEALQFLLE